MKDYKEMNYTNLTQEHKDDYLKYGYHYFCDKYGMEFKSDMELFNYFSGLGDFIDNEKKQMNNSK